MIPAVPSTATRSGLHNDVQHGIDQRHPVRQLAADAAATRGGGHRGAHSARDALGARHGKNPLMHQTKIPFMHQDNFRIFSCSKSTIRAPNLGEGQMF